MPRKKVKKGKSPAKLVGKQVKPMKKLEEVPVVRLSVFKFALAGGIITAICVFVTTLAGILGWFGGFSLWNSIIQDIYGSFGYNVSFLGAIIGAIYGFIDGFLATLIFAWIYNKLL